jgi:ATP-dependent RNA helicase DeaD
MLRDAGVQAFWSGPPTLDEIRKLDQERMLQDPLLTEPPAEEDIEMARLLLSERTPEQLGAALIRIYRARLPAIEDVEDPGDGPSRREMRDTPNTRDTRDTRNAPTRPAKAQKERFFGDAAWFRLDIGRSRNADPKWLLPMLCRKGNIAKGDIGVIRVFENETRVEISPKVAADFALSMKRPGGDNIRVERANDGNEGAQRQAAPRPPKPKYVSKADRKEKSRPEG